MGRVVELSKEEMVEAARVGVERRAESLFGGYAAVHFGNEDDTWTIDIEGALGEQAAANALGIPWSKSVNTFQSGGDVGEYQVRTARRDTDSLIVRPKDRNGDVFILVIGRDGHYRVCGWVYGWEAKQPRWQRAPNGNAPAWFVAQSALHSLDTLPKEEKVAA